MDAVNFHAPCNKCGVDVILGEPFPCAAKFGSDENIAKQCGIVGKPWLRVDDTLKATLFDMPPEDAFEVPMAAMPHIGGALTYEDQKASASEMHQAYLERQAESALATQVGGSHYKDMAIQPIQYCIANSIPFAEGNVIKYVSRWRKKGGSADLRKARHMLDVLIEAAEAKGL